MARAAGGIDMLRQPFRGLGMEGIARLLEENEGGADATRTLLPRLTPEYAAPEQISGTPVTTFKRSNRIYWRAERHNGDLDRDNDRIACEKR